MKSGFRQSWNRLLHRAESSRPRLIIEWKSSQITVSQVRFDAGVPLIECQTAVTGHENYGLDDPGAMGASVRQQMRRAGITPCSAVVTLPRQASLIRIVRLEGMENTEIPSAVALYVESLEHTLSRDLAYDYCIHRDDSGQALFATLVTCPREITGGIVEALDAAGITARMCSLAELAVGRLIPQNDSGTVIMLVAGDVGIDAVLIRNGQPVTALATRLGAAASDAAEQMENLCRRLRAGLPSEFGMSDVDCVYIAGGSADELVQQLNDPELNFILLPHAAANDRALVHAVALNGSSGSPTLDLLHPTLPEDPTRLRRIQRIRRVMPVAALCLLAVFGLQSWRQAKQEELRIITERIDRSRQGLQHAQPLLAQWNSLREWQTDRCDVSRELLRLHGHLPDQECICLVRLQLEDGVGEEAATLRLNGVARATSDVMELHHSLLQDQYRLKPHGIEPTSRDPQFQSQFQVETTLPHDASHSDSGDS